MKLEIFATTQQKVSITREDLGRAIFEFIDKEFFDGDFDDAGCDWLTNKGGTKVFIGSSNWLVSANPVVASLVDSANFLIHGEVLKLDDSEVEDWS